MARVTVEDCLQHVDNYFDLVLIASKRARQLAMGAEQPFLSWDHDKPTVMALREIAEGYVDDQILSDIIVGHQQTAAAAEASEAQAAHAGLGLGAAPEAEAVKPFTTTGFSTLDDQLKQRAATENTDQTDRGGAGGIL